MGVDWVYGDKYAAYLHDAVILYAMAVNDSLAAGSDPRDGEELMEFMKGKRFFGKLCICYISPNFPLGTTNS